MTHHKTGTRDETYNIVSILYHALQGADTCAQYEHDAVDDEDLRRFFQQAGQQQRELADQAKRVLRERLTRGEGGTGGESSAFGFGEKGSGTDAAERASTGQAASEI
jgi:hypothetical protein